MMRNYILTILAIFLSNSFGIFAQDWRFPDCRDLEVTQINFVNNDTLTVKIYNSCTDCEQHVYTGLEVYSSNGNLLAESFWPMTETSPSNNSDEVYELQIQQPFNLQDINRIKMTGNICNSIEINSNILTTEKINFPKEQITIFPNPSSYLIEIFNPTSTEILEVIINDLNGKTIKKIKSDFSSIKISDLVEGVYLITFQTQDSLLTKKLIVE